MDHASVDFEHEVWVAAVTELLRPTERDVVVAALHSDRDGRDDHDGGLAGDVWMALDPDALSVRDRAVAAEMLLAQHAAIGACRRYEQTRRTSHLREAVRELEAARRFERNQLASGLVVSSCGEEADRLGRALGQVLPPSAFRFFARVVREHIGAAMGPDRARGRRFRARGAEQQWLSREAWTGRADNEERAEGVWFIDWLQGRYDEEMERDRLAEEAEERRRREADAKRRKWQARRDEEARLKREEEEALEQEAVGRPSRELGAKGEASSHPGQARHGPNGAPTPDPMMRGPSVAQERADERRRAAKSNPETRYERLLHEDLMRQRERERKGISQEWVIQYRHESDAARAHSC